MKENVEKSIAPKEETIVEVELTTLQKKYYRAIYERNFTFLKKGGKSSNVPSLLNVMMELRKCCNHPYLIKGVEQNETDHLSLKEQVYQTLVDASGKMVLIDKLLPKLKAGGHKVLIFSQMVRVLDILEDYLVWKGYTHERLDGRIRGNDRQAAIDRFSKPDSDRFVFLLCTRAGGLGINLTAADTVIIFDSDWNPQNDVQAQARCHRIGQEKSVKVYRLITRNTYEKHMFERASKKLGLDQAVFTKMSTPTPLSGDDTASAPASDVVLDKKTIDSLLKYGAYDLFREDDTASNRFHEEDIDQILERATVVRSADSAGAPENALSSFSKASFVSNSAAPEIDINDPDFWLKLLPTAADAPNPNIQAQPRVRRQVHRFGALDGDDSDLEEDDGATLQSSDEDEPGRAYGQEKGWTLGERARFKHSLMSLGYGRWKELKTMARIIRWTPDEIALYGKAFLSKVIMFAEVDDPKVVENIQNAPVPKVDSAPVDSNDSSGTTIEGSVETMEPKGSGEHQDSTQAKLGTEASKSDSSSTNTVAPAQETSQETSFDRDPSLCDARFQEYLQKNSKQIFRRLETLANLRELVQSNFTALDDIEVPDSPAPWWGAEEDRSLLLGTYKHGFGRYEEIRNDPSLCFLGRVECKQSKEDTTETSANSENKTTTESGATGEQPNQSKPVNQEISIETTATSQPVATPPAQTPTVATPNLPWPSSKILSHRVKRILRSLDMVKRQQEKDTKKVCSYPLSLFLTISAKEQKVRERERKEEEKMKKKQELAAEWTKREKQDFYRALVTYPTV